MQDRSEQAEAELRHSRQEKDKYQTEFSHKHKAVEGDLDKLHLEISQLTTERDQLVRQLEKSQVKHHHQTHLMPKLLIKCKKAV